MAKKLTLILAAMAVVAFAVPAFASAAPEVTESAGKTAPKGMLIRGHSTNAVTVTSLGNLSCATVAVNGELTENTGTKVVGVGKGAGESTTCKLGGSKAITITDITLTSLTSTVSGSGTINVTFVADLPNGVICHFSSGTAPFTYTVGSDSIKLTNADLVGTPAACEPALLSGDFTIGKHTEVKETIEGKEVVTHLLDPVILD